MAEALIAFGKNGLGRKYTLTDPCTIGRHSDCEIQIVDSQISKKHAKIFLAKQKYRIQDLGSLNGVYVNSVKIDKPKELRPNDILSIGSQSFLFCPKLEVLPQADSHRVVLLVEDQATASGQEVRLEPDQKESFSDLPAEFVLDVFSILMADDAKKDLLKSVMTVVSRFLPYDAAAVLYASAPQTLQPLFIASSGPSLSLSKTIAQLAWQEKKGVRIPDAIGDTVLKEGKSVIKGKIRSVIAAPLLNQHESIGVVFLTKNKPDFYRDQDLKILLGMGTFIALAACQGERSSILRKQIRHQIELKAPVAEMCGSGPAMQEIKSTIKKVAPTSSSVLICGETGTGKELIARSLHAQGRGHSRPFVAVNCGAIPESLFESELLGYEKGAFSGAQGQRIGKLELASRGTLFLDEIGEMPLPMQVKLLRALDQKCFYRLGGVKTIEVDFRLLAASNRDLEKMAGEGSFRQDLYYRLNVIGIEVPPLRDRPEDIEALAKHFITQLNAALGKKVQGIDGRALALLHSYPWPGNIRELKNILERVMALSDTAIITGDQLPFDLQSTGDQARAGHSQDLALGVQALERKMIAAALKKARGKKSQAAKQLGISRPTLDKKLAQYEIDIYQG